MDSPIMPLGILLCLALSAYFSSTETALSSVSRPRLKSLEEAGEKRAKTAIAVVDQYDNALSAILIGNNIVNITASALGTVFCTDIFGASLGPLMSTIIMTLLVLTFGEIFPKSIAKENSEKIALMFVGPLSGHVISGSWMSSSGVNGSMTLTSRSYVMMLMFADSRAKGSPLRLESMASRPTFTDSMGSPVIEPDVSINRYTGNLLISPRL